MPPMTRIGKNTMLSALCVQLIVVRRRPRLPTVILAYSAALSYRIVSVLFVQVLTLNYQLVMAANGMYRYYTICSPFVACMS